MAATAVKTNGWHILTGDTGWTQHWHGVRVHALQQRAGIMGFGMMDMLLTAAEEVGRTM
jgi:hypothetical protein